MEYNFNDELENFHNKEKLKKYIKNYFSKRINQINIISTNQDEIISSLMDEGYLILKEIEQLKKLIEFEKEYNQIISKQNNIQSKKKLGLIISTYNKNNNNSKNKNMRISLSKSQEKGKIFKDNNSVFEKLYRYKKRVNTSKFQNKFSISALKIKNLKEYEKKNSSPKIKNLMIRNDNKSKTVKNNYKFINKRNNKNSMTQSSKKSYSILRLNFSKKLEIKKQYIKVERVLNFDSENEENNKPIK